MLINESNFGESIYLKGYGNGGFVLSSGIHRGSLLLLPNGPEGVELKALADIDRQTAQKVIDAAAEFDVILIGCGANIAPLPAAIRQAFDEENVPYDLMDTGAACRTFNVLLAEERRVAALLVATE